jgi:hypothetical protein
VTLRRAIAGLALASMLAGYPAPAEETTVPGFRLTTPVPGSPSGDALSASPLAGAFPVPSLTSLETAEKGGKPSFVAVPLPNSNPTIGTGLGAAALLFFRASKADTVSPSSTAGLGGIYFDTKSWAVAGGVRLNMREDRWRVTAAIAGADLRYDLYGPGAEVSPTSGVGVKQSMFGGLLQAQVRAVSRVYLGARYVLAQVKTEVENAGTPLPPGVGRDQADLRVAALGPVVSFDSRDNQFFPLTGWAADLRADFYGSGLGSEYGFEKYELNVRAFFPIREGDALAAQVYACGIGGRAPFFLQCLYGSAGVLRGYPVGKYYDETMFGAQVEYRWHVLPRWIVAGFVGVGGVAPTFGSYSSDNLLPAAGIGVRWIAEPKEKATLRLDYAWGKDRGAFYLSIGEAF